MQERSIHQERRMPHERPVKHERPINTRRRNILKFGALGAGAFILGKIFGPSINFFSGSVGGTAYDFKNFRVIENNQELGFFDNLGNEILILEKDPNAGK